MTIAHLTRFKVTISLDWTLSMNLLWTVEECHLSPSTNINETKPLSVDRPLLEPVQVLTWAEGIGWVVISKQWGRTRKNAGKKDQKKNISILLECLLLVTFQESPLWISRPGGKLKCWMEVLKHSAFIQECKRMQVSKLIILYLCSVSPVLTKNLNSWGSLFLSYNITRRRRSPSSLPPSSLRGSQTSINYLDWSFNVFNSIHKNFKKINFISFHTPKMKYATKKTHYKTNEE